MKRSRAILAALAMVAIPAAPAAAHAPLRSADDTTAVTCDALTGDAGTVRLAAGASSASGSGGFLRFWSAGLDPNADQPTLVSMGVTAGVAPDGTFTATYEMFSPGDLGITDTEPVFVGTAELTASVAPIGDVVLVDVKNRNGNDQFRMEGTRQALSVTGSVGVPTAGTFPLTGCEGERESLTFFVTQPDASVSTIDRTRIECFWTTGDGFIGLDAQADDDEVFAQVTVIEGGGASFGLGMPALTPEGVDATIELDTGGTASLAADFTAVERIKFKAPSENHWVMVTIEILSVAGTLSVDRPGGALQLPMDDASCLADARTVRSLTTAPGP